MDNINFTGNIWHKTYKKGVPTSKKIITTIAQDKEIKKTIESIIPPEKRNTTWPVEMKKEDVEIFHNLIEKILKYPMKKINNEKAIFVSDNQVVFGDRTMRLLDGEQININYSV